MDSPVSCETQQEGHWNTQKKNYKNKLITENEIKQKTRAERQLTTCYGDPSSVNGRRVHRHRGPNGGDDTFLTFFISEPGAQDRRVH